MDLLINRSASDRAGLLSLVNGDLMRSTARLPLLIRNDGEPITVRVFDPSDSGVREFEEVDISTAAVRVGIGLPDLAPTAGTFTISETTASEITGAFGFDASAALMELALNLLTAVDAAGGITVAKPSPGTYQVTFIEPGIQTARFTANTAQLAPLSVATVSRVQQGNVDVQEIVLIQLIQNAYVYNLLADALPAAGSSVTRIQEGTSELPDIQRVRLRPLPYAGTFKMTIAGKTIVGIPFNVSRAQLQSMVGPKFDVEQTGNSEWIIQSVEPGAIAGITIDLDGLVVPTGVKGTLALNTVEIWRAFAVTTAKLLTFILEVQLKFPGESARTILQMPVQMSRNVLNLDTIAAANLLALSETFTVLFGGTPAIWGTGITSLTGGGNTALDGIPTTLLGTGARMDFRLTPGGPIQSWVIESGTADPADPGQVAPLDFNAGTNNKHWEQEL